MAYTPTRYHIMHARHTQGTAKGSPLAAIAGDPRFGPVVTVSLGEL